MIEPTIYYGFGVAVLSVFITGFYTPLQPFKDWLLDKLPDNYLGRTCRTVFNCPKCFSFIFSLILFWDILAACLISLTAYFINHFIDRVESWYE
jgi:hypothetical protein